MENGITINTPSTIASKVADYAALTKMKLSFLVVFSAAMAFIMGSAGDVNWSKFLLLIAGGFLVTGAANAFNQVIEKDLDKLMDRTRMRPLADGRMGVSEALIVSSLLAVCGLAILFTFMNTASGILGLIAIISYTIIYTPLKRITPFAVFVGAFPGAIPPLLGWVAATNSFSTEAWVLFSIQFIWQFPHFWAIAWVLDDDYKKAGFELLPSKGGRDKSSAFQAFIYAFSLIPVGIIPYFFELSGVVSMVVLVLAGIYFTILAWNLYKSCSMEAARKLMFGSFIYLPVVQIIMVLDKI
ncbi:MAG: heme o synthase [Bacteroidia bacterium]|nr:protoheme IX farnesyltransferase [Bacteroidota bacterium]MBP9082554.1 heme o synthase [Bacteroidia bacterium]MBK7390441.1 protoheme IX farnesyltransferase [Bacteroidota bacterium]MBK7970607.1 protoheme IX farnesyltransferase [Bacteroidota bacterium]MBK8873586.1 protoheme IX farnesyltransferase [Bacteroidota bacterium]